MAAKVPPIRAPFFDGEIEISGSRFIVRFLRTTREWANWAANMARGVGPVVETLCVTEALNFPSVAAGASEDLTVVVTGVLALDSAPVVSIGVPSGVNAGLVFHGFVSGDDEVTVRATNATAAPINPGSHTFRVEVRRY